MVVALLLLLLLLLLVDGAAAVTTTAYSVEAVDVAICAISCSPTDSTIVQVAMMKKILRGKERIQKLKSNLNGKRRYSSRTGGVNRSNRTKSSRQK